MRNFLLGVLSTLVILVTGGYAYLKSGEVDIRADQQSSPLETRFAMSAVDASLDRHAALEKNPLPRTEENLVKGAKLYVDHCAGTDLWHFYAGKPLALHVIDPEGEYSRIFLGGDLEAGAVLQAVVDAGCWFASHVAEWNSFALVGCTVAPGFDFEDLEMGKNQELVARYPQHRALIERLTRE